MDPKPKPNHARYIEVLRNMTPQERLDKAFELSAFTRELFVAGLRKSHSEASPEELRHILLKRLERCHNQNS